MRSPSELSADYRSRGLKLTPQRQLLFRLLYGNEAHPSAELLFAAASEVMPGISLRTVYQTLNELVAIEEIRTLDLGDGPLRFDPNIDRHHHLLCRSCASLVDVYVEQVPLPGTNDLHGFAVETADVVYRGRCASCQVVEVAEH